MKIKTMILLALVAAVTAFATGATTPESVSDLIALGKDGAAREVPCKILAKVIHASALRKGVCVVAELHKLGSLGVVVFLPEGIEVESGDVVAIEGRTCVDMFHPCLRADTVSLIRQDTLQKAKGRKFSDLRVGNLHARRIALTGDIGDIKTLCGVDGVTNTVFTLRYGNNFATIRMPGEWPGDRPKRGWASVTGAAFNTYNESGSVYESILELENANDIYIYPFEETFAWRYVAIGVGAVLAATLVVLFVFWLKVRRERIAARAVAQDRKRMAADLHDTIEQHLAGVKIMLAAALRPDGIPEKTRDMVMRANDMLAYAKGEVRTAVMDMRGDIVAQSLRSLLQEIADGVNRAGEVRVRMSLRGLPENLERSRTQNLVMIVREAVTNAIKHGNARNIAIVGDPFDGGFVLRILNDGTPFDRSTALGPETGHYGLAGMEERAKRGNFKLSFGSDDRWMQVKLEVSL